MWLDEPSPAETQRRETEVEFDLKRTDKPEDWRPKPQTSPLVSFLYAAGSLSYLPEVFVTALP